MKKTLLIALLLIPFFGFTQTTKPITSFLGIKFGSSRIVVLEAMKAKGYTINKSISNADNLVYNNVKLGHRLCGFAVRFVNNKAFEADYILVPNVEAQCIDEYNNLVNEVNAIYGVGDITKNYSSPYTEGGDDTLTGLAAGKIDLHTLWSDADNNTIKASISPDMNITLSYQNAKLVEEAIAHQQKKDASDF